MDEQHLEKLAKFYVRVDSMEYSIMELRRLAEDGEGNKRLASLERTQDKMGHTLEQINKTLAKFENHIDELFDVKSKLESIETAWKRIDVLQQSITNMDKILSLLAAEHTQCKPKVEGIEGCKISIDHRLTQLERSMGSASNFVQGRVASLTDKLLWVGFGAVAVVAVILALQGVGK